METLPENIANFWQFAAFALTAVGLPLVSYFCKRWIAKSDELEAERTKNRKHDRDSKFAEVRQKHDDLERVVLGLGKSFDEHKNKDIGIENQFREFDKRLQNIEKNLIERREFEDLRNTVHNVDKNMTRIAAILEERLRMA
jgi:hypothetical protein